jgi:acetyl esterase/lipase
LYRPSPDIDHATRLLRAGVATELHVYAGAPHGFDALMPEYRHCSTRRRDLKTWLANQLNQGQDRHR